MDQLSKATTAVSQGSEETEQELLAIPASFAQQRLWFLDQFYPGCPAYLMPVALRIEGGLNPERLGKSLQLLIERHEILRTSFATIDGQLMQIVAPTVFVPLVVEQVAGDHLLQREATVIQRLREEASRSFDLHQGPLLRTSLFVINTNLYILLLTLHHSIADGWSIGILLSELGMIYSALDSGEPVRLPELTIQYADYAIWQNEWLAGRRLEQLTEYWRRRLAGIPTFLDLPSDRTRPTILTFRGSLYEFFWPREDLSRLESLCERTGVTLFMALLALFQVLLYRYTGQPDLVVGTPVAGRTRPEAERVIGFFVNTLVLRGELAGNPRFSTYLQEVRRTCLEAFAHQEMPFEKLVSELQTQRDSSRLPIVQAVLALQNIPFAREGFDGLSLKPVRIDNGSAKFDLMFEFQPNEQGLRGTVEYNSDLFNTTTIAYMVGHLSVLLQGILENPDTRIDDLSLLTHSEQQQMLAGWNSTSKDYPRDASVQALFETQVEQHPDRPAVVFAREQLSYRELNQQANQLAYQLRRLGVGPDVPVALCLERSLEVLVAILAVFKAGGVYVPLDPEYPPERLLYMLEDCRAPVLLLQNRLQDRFPQYSGTVLFLDSGWDEIGCLNADNLPRTGTGDNLAYIIYTSGSTGHPKGVMVRQQGLLNLCYGLRAFFDDPGVRDTALITSISFDISVNQIFPTLLFGKTLHLISDTVKYESTAFFSYIKERQIQLFDCVPSYLNALLNDAEDALLENELRYILIGGEKLEKRLLGKAFERLGEQLRIVNIYGLTEITDVNSVSVISARQASAAITIGRPLQNNQVYVLNSSYHLQPVRVIGEVCIAGESLSRGYLDQPALTAEKFVPSPFADGESLCRTGDLGRWLPDGTIELLGRKDHQAKLRGFRIETAEIEAQLDRHAAVRENVVIVREDQPGDQRLVAYVVLQSGEEPTVQALRVYLQQSLPAYMLPTFVLRDALPHTPNGKIDRKQLPRPGERSSVDDTAFVAARTPTEELLVRLWARELGVPRVGVTENFFELGGHSLLATRLVMQMQKQLGIQMPLRRLFESPMVGEIASYIDILRQLKTLAHVPQTPPDSDTVEGVL